MWPCGLCSHTSLLLTVSCNNDIPVMDVGRRIFDKVWISRGFYSLPVARVHCGLWVVGITCDELRSKKDPLNVVMTSKKISKEKKKRCCVGILPFREAAVEGSGFWVLGSGYGSFFCYVYCRGSDFVVFSLVYSVYKKSLASLFSRPPWAPYNINQQ